MVQEKNQELPQESTPANCFRLYFTYAISVAVNSLPEFSSYSLSDVCVKKSLNNKINFLSKCDKLTF